MTMTDEMLDLYKALQPVFKKAMGPKHDGDILYCHAARHLYFEGTYHPCPLSVSCAENEILCEDRLLRLPLPIDPVNPERGLWGMVDWSLGYVIFVTEKGSVWVRDKDGSTIAYDSPTLALLKVLAHQHNVGVK